MDQLIQFLLINLHVILSTSLVRPQPEELTQVSDVDPLQQLELNQQQKTIKVSALRLQMEEKGKPPFLEGYKEGPHSLISDSLFSLIIFIYVSVTFLYMFYAFCWREEHPDMSKMANMAMSQQTQDMEIGDSEESDFENGNGAIKMQVTAA